MTLFDPTGGTGISYGQSVTHENFTDCFKQLPFALDGNAGGTYAPSVAITIGGSGLHLTTPGIFDTWTGNFVNIAALQCTSSTLHDVAVDGAADFTGTLDLHTDATFRNKNAVFKDGGGATIGTIGAGAGLVWTILAGFTGEVDFQAEVVLSGAGRIRQKVVYGPDTNHTYSEGDATRIVINTLTSSHDYTLNDAANVGAEITFLNWDATYDVIVKDSGGAARGKVPKSTVLGVPGSARFMWYFNGAATSWWPESQHT